MHLDVIVLIMLPTMRAENPKSPKTNFQQRCPTSFESSWALGTPGAARFCRKTHCKLPRSKLNLFKESGAFPNISTIIRLELYF